MFLLHVSVFSFCLIACVWGLLSAGCKVIVLNCGVYPSVGGAGPMPCDSFMVRRTCAWILLGGAGSFLFEGQYHIQWCVLGAFRSGMALGSLSANVQGCVPVLLMVWYEASGIGACCLLGRTLF